MRRLARLCANKLRMHVTILMNSSSLSLPKPVQYIESVACTFDLHHNDTVSTTVTLVNTGRGENLDYVLVK